MIENHPPAPFTDKHKPKDPKPHLPIDNYCDYFVIVTIVLGFLSINCKRLIK